MSVKVLVLCMVAAVTTGYDAGCQYQLNQCYGKMQNIEQKVNQVEAKQNMMEGRQSSVTQAFSRELTMLDQNSKTVKSVVNTLVEDNVEMHGDIRLLKVNGDILMGLRREVDTVKQATKIEISGVKNKINKVSQSLQQESDAVNKVTGLMSNQMRKNDESLQELKTKTRQLEEKVNTVEQRAATVSTGNVGGRMDELEARLGSIQENYGQKIQDIENKLKNLLR